jgi:ATP-binding cassette subfamily B protein
MAIPVRITDGPRRLPSGPLGVEFDRVTFGYSANEPVLRELSFCLAPGQVLGVLGRTGIGKTTLTRLLVRLYDPRIGVIRLAAHDIREVRLDDLRRRVGLVTQEVQVFHATVRENLSLFDASLADSDMLTVLDDLGLTEWLQRLPSGLDTRLAPAGSGLSAGEAQLLAFARVFLRQPGLVILDEASSRLDPATERRIEHAVDRLLECRTAIIIAHRLSTIARVDQVLVLDAQGIREFGARKELEADPESALSSLLRAGNLELLA